jgi:hypothetical protein
VDVVELFASGARRRLRVRPEAYARLYRSLLDSCRAIAKDAEPSQQAFYYSLGELVQPWLSARILAKTERTLLAHLLESSLRAERRLTGRKRRPWLRRWRRRGVALAAGASPMIFLAIWYIRPVGVLHAWLADVRVWLADVVAGVTSLQWLLVSGFVAALACMVLVTRARKN